MIKRVPVPCEFAMATQQRRMVGVLRSFALWAT